MNITDIDDKTIAKSHSEHPDLDPREALRLTTRRYEELFLDDLRAVGVDTSLFRLVRATESIPQMQQMIRDIHASGFAYVVDGSVYFDLRAYRTAGNNYGRLAKVDFAPQARIDNDEYDKNEAQDFVLWKSQKPGEPAWDFELARESLPGRPGWHIECSAMAVTGLGQPVDIHTGGIDLAFPHHENEIAQSEAATGKPFVRYWMHAEHLLVEGEKMSKSLGNFFTLRDLFAKGYKPSALRFALASVPYRRQLNFTFDGLQQAASSVERLRNFAARLKNERFPAEKQAAMAERIAKAAANFDAGLSDDLNTAQALAAVFDFVREANIAMDKGEFRQGEVKAAQEFLATFDKVFAVLEDNDAEKLKALGYGASEGPGDAEIEKLVAERQAARKRKDFAESDRIRNELLKRGILLEDTKDGSVRWKRK